MFRPGVVVLLLLLLLSHVTGTQLACSVRGWFQEPIQPTSLQPWTTICVFSWKPSLPVFAGTVLLSPQEMEPGILRGGRLGGSLSVV